MVQTTNNEIDNTTKMSIQVSLNGLSFCIKKNGNISFLEIDNFGIQLTPEQVLEKIKFSLNSKEELKDNFDSIEVIHQNDLYSTIPKSLFDESKLSEYLKYNIKVLQSDFIAFDLLEQQELVVTYVPYININNFFFDTFGAFVYKHSNTILVNTLLLQEKNTDSIRVFANINENSFDLIVISKGKLILNNTYKYHNKEDFLYYLMYSTEQLKLNPEEFELIFLGKIKKEDELYSIAYAYIRNVSFGKTKQNLTLTPDIQYFEPHENFVLLSQF